MKKKITISSEKRKDIINKAIPITLLAIMLISGFNSVSAFMNYRAANKEYTGLAQYVAPATSGSTEAQSTTASDNPEAITETAEAQAGEDTTAAEATEAPEETVILPEIPDMDIDFDSLASINEDFVGWLIVPALEISYPILKGPDNEHYLHETFEHNRNKAGAIFMDSFNYPDFRDLNTFIYGHNMRDGSMFGSLKKLGEQPELIDDEPYIYVYTPRASYQFQIVAYYTTYKKSDTYQFITNPREYDAYLDYIGEVNELTNVPKTDLSEYPKLMTLSTCKGSAGTSNRFVIHSVLVSKVKNE